MQKEIACFGAAPSAVFPVGISLCLFTHFVQQLLVEKFDVRFETSILCTYELSSVPGMKYVI